MSTLEELKPWSWEVWTLYHLINGFNTGVSSLVDIHDDVVEGYDEVLISHHGHVHSIVF